MNRTAPRVPRHHHRSGFSLLELLAAIVIISILVALLFPAIGAVRRRAQITQVSAEMTQLEQAIATFKALYGVEPPSSLHIPAPGTSPAWSAADQSKVRAIWPQFNFVTRGGLDPAFGEQHLSGAECLVFFLGGVTPATSVPRQVQLLGFSKNPETPWSNAGQNREGPFFQFDTSRLVNVDSAGNIDVNSAVAPDKMFEYVDPLPNQQTPMMFISSQGKNYHATNSTTGTNNLATQDDFDVHGGIDNAKDLDSIYTKVGNQPHRPNGYQIISPGLDGEFGTGGIYTVPGDVDSRKLEQDNITNFTGGALQ